MTLKGWTWRAGLLLGAAVLSVTAAGAAESAAAKTSALETKIFTVRHRSVQEVLALIQPALSERGSYAVQPTLKAVTVTDIRQSLQKVEALLAGFDLPPRGI